ncbi:MAG: hypothetical protein U0P47_14205 [Acidimicrobiales bacterium]
MVAFFTSLLVAILLVAPIFPYAKRRPVGTPITWGEAILAGTYVFFILFWIYGVVPHQFLTWADSELSWRPDRIWLGPNGVMVVPFTGWTLQTPWFPVQVSAQAVRDIWPSVSTSCSWVCRCGCGRGGRSGVSAPRQRPPPSPCPRTVVP